MWDGFDAGDGDGPKPEAVNPEHALFVVAGVALTVALIVHLYLIVAG